MIVRPVRVRHGDMSRADRDRTVVFLNGEIAENVIEADVDAGFVETLNPHNIAQPITRHSGRVCILQAYGLDVAALAFLYELERQGCEFCNASTHRDDCLLVRVLEHSWSARGEADLLVTTDALATLMGNRAAVPYVNRIGEAVRALDDAPKR